jgi:lysophospholipase L1-like esterase
MKNLIKPPYFGAAADQRRDEFDYKNETIFYNEIPVDIVFIGDSITQLWELNAYFREFGLVLNRGIGGDTTDIVAKRFFADVIQLKPKVCVIKIGINNTWPLENGEEQMTSEQIFDIIINSYIEILEMCKENSQKLIVSSVLPVSCVSPKLDERNELILKVNKRLQELCSQYSFEFVDYHYKMTRPDGKTLLDGLAEDGLHPRYKGYNIMANVLKPVLKKILD